MIGHYPTARAFRDKAGKGSKGAPKRAVLKGYLQVMICLRRCTGVTRQVGELHGCVKAPHQATSHKFFRKL